MAKEATKPVIADEPPLEPRRVEAEPASLAIFAEPDDLNDHVDFLSSCLQTGLAKRRNILEAIFAKCKREGSCMVWQGPHSGSGRGGGYGRFSFQGVTCSVHRTVYAAVYGPIPPRKQVDHDCNNRLCCNPYHLVAMTHKRNQKLRDKRRKNEDRV